MKPSIRLAEALAVTAEVCGADMSDAAATIYAADLSKYPEHLVLGALARVRRELKGRLSLASIIERIDDGRPGSDEAWAMVPRDELTTSVLTRETLRAMRVAQPLLDEGDQIAARMAFRDSYDREVRESKDRGEAVVWEVSLGHDSYGRTGALVHAVELGRLSPERALTFVSGAARDQLAQTLSIADPRNEEIADQVRAAIAKIAH